MTLCFLSAGLDLLMTKITPGELVLWNRFSGSKITPSSESFLTNDSRIFLSLLPPLEPLPRDTAPVSRMIAALPVSEREENICWIHPQSALFDGGYPRANLPKGSFS